MNMVKVNERILRMFLLILIYNLFSSSCSSGHTQHLALTTSGTRVLTTHSVTPVVTNTSVRADLLHSLDIGADGCDKIVDGHVGGLSGGEILLSVDEPAGDLELLGVHNDSNELLNLLIGQGARPTVHVNFRLLADQVGETLANTANLGHGEHHLSLTLDVGVQHTQNVRELRGHLQTL